MADKFQTDVFQPDDETQIPCLALTLPSEQRVDAAATAVRINPVNAPAVEALTEVFDDIVLDPDQLALLTSKYWGAEGVHLTASFLDNPESELRARILSHMNAWSEFANVQFVESAVDAVVRIARTPGKGYWSYVGTDVLHISPDEPTMNLASFTMQTADATFVRVVRHETGHTMGFPHEHLREEIINRIDRAKALAYFMATQGWDEAKVIHNVLTPIPNSALNATAEPDVTSIMTYPMPSSIMLDGVAVPGGRDIDSQDADFAGLLYPLPRAIDLEAPAMTRSMAGVG